MSIIFILNKIIPDTPDNKTEIPENIQTIAFI
jgi:hypothetical protein